MDERRSYAWKRQRAGWARRIADGDVTCPRCGRPIIVGQPWDLGHLLDAQHGGTAADGVTAEHRWCNRSAGARSRRRRPSYTPAPW